MQTWRVFLFFFFRCAHPADDFPVDLKWSFRWTFKRWRNFRSPAGQYQSPGFIAWWLPQGAMNWERRKSPRYKATLIWMHGRLVDRYFILFHALCKVDFTLLNRSEMKWSLSEARAWQGHFRCFWPLQGKCWNWSPVDFFSKLKSWTFNFWYKLLLEFLIEWWKATCTFAMNSTDSTALCLSVPHFRHCSLRPNWWSPPLLHSTLSKVSHVSLVKAA